MEDKFNIPGNTGFKLLEYVIRLSIEHELTAKYETDPFIAFLLDRKYILNDLEENDNIRLINTRSKKRYISGRLNTKYRSTPSLKNLVDSELIQLYREFKSFLTDGQMNYLENTISIGDLRSLIELSKVYSSSQQDLTSNITESPKLTFQEILSKYFSGSKHTKPDSNLGKAIKIVVGGDSNIDLRITNQVLLVLYPKETSCYIVLCENINRLGASRHKNIEFWYCGGRNTSHLQYISKPKLPIYYLFDWDFDGISIYLHIKEKYFPSLKPIIPPNYRSLSKLQEEVKHHHSKWRGKEILSKLTPDEYEIVNYLIDTDRIIEEQSIIIHVIEETVA